jgi:hypothetical protein
LKKIGFGGFWFFSSNFRWRVPILSEHCRICVNSADFWKKWSSPNSVNFDKFDRYFKPWTRVNWVCESINPCIALVYTGFLLQEAPPVWFFFEKSRIQCFLLSQLIFVSVAICFDFPWFKATSSIPKYLSLWFFYTNFAYSSY